MQPVRIESIDEQNCLTNLTTGTFKNKILFLLRKKNFKYQETGPTTTITGLQEHKKVVQVNGHGAVLELDTE
jgi:FMN-dependent NADH-azoreductase